MKTDIVLDTFISSSLSIATSSGGDTGEGVTIACEGVVVSGRIISAVEYLNSHPYLEAIANGAMQAVDSEENPNESWERLMEEKYLHLRDARIFSPGQDSLPSRNAEGLFWRCRRDLISGYSLGQFKAL